MKRRVQKLFRARGSQLRLFFEISEYLGLYYGGDRPKTFDFDRLEDALRRRAGIDAEVLCDQIGEERVDSHLDTMAGMLRANRGALDHLDLDVTFLFAELIPCWGDFENSMTPSRGAGSPKQC